MKFYSLLVAVSILFTACGSGGSTETTASSSSSSINAPGTNPVSSSSEHSSSSDASSSSSVQAQSSTGSGVIETADYVNTPGVSTSSSKESQTEYKFELPGVTK